MQQTISFQTPASARALREADLLAHAPLFRGLSPEEIARVAAGTQRLHVDRGQVLFRRGDACQGCHLVVYGQVKLTVSTSAGAEKVIEIIGPGHSFGEAVMFMDKPYLVNATALADTLLLHVSKRVLFDEIDNHPGLGRRMLAGLAMRLHMMVRDVEAMALHSATQRVIGYLARLEDDAGGGPITLPAQKSLIASRLNLTPEYFSRILHDLSAAGAIRIDGREIEVLDAAALRSFGS